MAGVVASWVTCVERLWMHLSGKHSSCVVDMVAGGRSGMAGIYLLGHVVMWSGHVVVVVVETCPRVRVCAYLLSRLVVTT